MIIPIISGIIILGLIALIMTECVIDKTQMFHNITLSCFAELNGNTRHPKIRKTTLMEIDKIRNRVLHSAEIYEPNDVLDIIDEIIIIIRSEEKE